MHRLGGGGRGFACTGRTLDGGVEKKQNMALGEGRTQHTYRMPIRRETFGPPTRTGNKVKVLRKQAQTQPLSMYLVDAGDKKKKKVPRTRHASSSFSLLKPLPRRSSARTQALASLVLTPRPKAAWRSATKRGTCHQSRGRKGRVRE